MNTLISIEEDLLLEFMYWARRYYDGRSTYAPCRFNQLYEKIVQLHPHIKQRDQFDMTLKDKGKYWPYAQDGMFDEKTGSYDARTRSIRDAKVSCPVFPDRFCESCEKEYVACVCM